MFVGADPAGIKIEADLTVTGSNWIAGDQPVVSEDDTWAGIGVYQPDALAGVDPCSGDWQGRDASGTRRHWPGSWSGSRGAPSSRHSRRPRRSATTPSTCGCGSTTSAAPRVVPDSPWASRGSRHHLQPSPTEVLIDFWVVDLDGTMVVVDMWHQVDAPTELVGRASQVRDSITFVTGERSKQCRETYPGTSLAFGPTSAPCDGALWRQAGPAWISAWDRSAALRLRIEVDRHGYRSPRAVEARIPVDPLRLARRRRCVGRGCVRRRRWRRSGRSPLTSSLTRRHLTCARWHLMARGPGPSWWPCTGSEAPEGTWWSWRPGLQQPVSSSSCRPTTPT